RALSHPEVGFDGAAGNGGARQQTVRIRLTAPSHRSLLTLPRQDSKRVCGALVVGRKDIVTFSDKDRRNLAEAAEELEAALVKAGVPALGAVPAAAPSTETGAGAPNPLWASLGPLSPTALGSFTRPSHVWITAPPPRPRHHEPS